MKALNELIERNARLVGISFGNPYILMSFPKLQTYLVAYGDMLSLQEATAEALMGQIDVKGRLPISLPGMYPRGAGIVLKAHAHFNDQSCAINHCYRVWSRILPSINSQDQFI